MRSFYNNNNNTISASHTYISAMNYCHDPSLPSRESTSFQLVENWLQGLLDNDEKPDIHRKRAAYQISSPPLTRRTPSPTKRRRVNEDDGNSEAPSGGDGFRQDLDTEDVTPRPNRILSERIRSDLPHTPTASEKGQNSVGNGRDGDAFSEISSISARSGRSSPTKREAAMRNTNDLPLHRIPIDELLALPSVDPSTALLVKDLAAIRGRIGILPGVLKPLFESQKSIGDHLDDTMFTGLTAATDGSVDSDEDIKFQHRRLLRIRKSSLQCSNAARPVHEAEWNDKVHAPILELALDANPGSEETLVFHNVMNTRIAAPFRDSSALLEGSMVDYGIFLAPAIVSPLGSLITSFMTSSRFFTQLNALESFKVDRPLAIAIETKRTRGGDANAPSQLANFARAHFRVVRYLFRASNQNFSSSGGFLLECRLPV
ncbi:hypothetical protein GGR58DRAFT_503156 [Xylaria digitata]|nr:hypothetical protein GGR58DRAFT_503156 [Xylaria digitata]